MTLANITKPVPSHAERSAQRATEAVNALIAAETFAEARLAWEDFLTHWRRGLNRCDGKARRDRSKQYVPSHNRVRADPALAYLWAARNAEEHGLNEIAIVQQKALAIGALDGYRHETSKRGSHGEWVFKFTPLTDQPPPFVMLLPEHIELQTINDGRTDVPVPPGYTYIVGETSAPVALATYGLNFLFKEISDLTFREDDQDQGPLDFERQHKSHNRL